MKRTSIFLLLLVAGTLPALAQSTEFGVLIGGSRRFVDNTFQPATPAIDDTFSLSNTSLELYYEQPIDSMTSLRLKIGRMEGSVAFPAGDKLRTDTEGQITHISGVAQYEFDEPFGSTGIFGGLGLYRQTASGFDAEQSFGVQLGVNGDFPLSRRYGVVVEATYHWIHMEVRPRYLTLGAGLRVAF